MPKYVVYKYEDWRKHTGWGSVAEVVEDAVVIRRQDVFAPAMLDLYASQLVTYIQMANGNLDADVRASLQEAADYFSEQASIAWDTNRKLPD